MNILLSTSPHVRHPGVLQSDFQINPTVMLPFSPIGLLSLISAVRLSLQIEPTLFDLNRRIIDGTIPVGPGFYSSAAESLCSAAPDMMGFMTENESYHHILQISREVKRLRPSCIVVLGGPHASAVAAATLRSYDCIDYVLQGEGEVSFPELVRHCMEGDPRPVAGVWQRSTGGEVVFGGERSLIEDLDTLPYPAYELYQPDLEEEIFFEVGRGCPFQCTFCSTAPFWKRTHRVKSGTRIVEELLHVIRLYGCRRMHFIHDLFTTSNAWVREVCEALRRAGTPVRWTCSSRSDTVDAQLLELMAAAGCSAIYFGLESGSARILHEIRKHIDLAHSFDTLAHCQAAGIVVNAGFIGGFPGEDIHSLAETFDAYATALEMGCAPVHLFQFTPYEDSSIIGQLDARICTGHFLDLPLGHDLDIANRKLVASDAVLFGHYHRPWRREADGIGEELIDALEEFPPLVSSAILPTLALARLAGGMFEVFKRWVTWISNYNEARGAEPFRRCFGSPMLFVEFLVDQAQSVDEFPPSLISILRVIHMSHRIAGQEHAIMATTMANYRTGLMPDSWSVIELSTPLAMGDIVGQLEIDHDVEAILVAKPPDPLPEAQPGPMFLLWQRTAPGRVRLLKVDAFTFYAVRHLQKSACGAADILQAWVMDSGISLENRDLFACLDQLVEAARLGIIQKTPLGAG